MKRLSLLLFLTTVAAVALAEELQVSRFSAEGLAGWERKSFKGTTDYRLVQEEGRSVVKAHSRGAASGLTRKLKVDPGRYRYLRWSWKVAAIVKNGDERTKAGDDYAARVYVVFPGRFFWQTRAINYIWANRLPRGESTVSAYTSNSMMVAVESGPGRVGQWISEERDLLADYRRLFGEEPGEIGAVAIMTDTDNTGGEAIAWYGDIVLSTDR
ncbi:MAG: DUF3047 domain-containing protein [Deltaproteobacteria bacterium]|nr:DUF3047 domain-containing protein [Deltaproteobacteria bacterium]